MSRNAPISDNYLISLLVMENLCILCCVIGVIAMSTLNKQAWVITFVVGCLLKKKKKHASPLSNMMH